MLSSHSSVLNVSLLLTVNGQPAPPSLNSFVLAGARPPTDIIQCRATGLPSLVTGLEPSLNWSVTPSTALPPFNALSGLTPPNSYSVATPSGNVTVTVSSGVGANITITPQFNTALSGEFACFGTVAGTMVERRVVIVTGEPALIRGCAGVKGVAKQAIIVTGHY